MTAEILARIQFAYTIAFHYIFPPLSIGLGLVLVFMEGKYLLTKNKIWETMTRFWVKIFAIIFAIGVASGIVMEFEFGTNWAAYSRYVGDIFGSALAAEGLFAFALESGFLGVMLFSWNRVPKWVHFISTLGVAIGSIFSAVWILVANSWMQTPAGYRIVGEGAAQKAEITDFWAMVFNPSTVDRITHTLIAAVITGAFFVLSVNAYYILKRKYLEISVPAFKLALIFATVACVLQLVSGHSSASGVSVNQPTKLAALEGHYDSLAPVPLYLVGWVDQKNQKTHGIGIPGGTSFLIHQDFKAPVKGLSAFQPDERPDAVNLVFQSYHLMVLLGLTMIGMTLLASFLWWRHRLFTTKWLMKLFVIGVIFPQLANQVGWIAAEVGRQPWIVYGLLRTKDALSQSVSTSQIWFSLILFSLVYTLLFVLFLYLLNKKIKNGPYHLVNDEKHPRQEVMGESL